MDVTNDVIIVSCFDRNSSYYGTFTSETIYVNIAHRNDPPQLALRDTTVLQGGSIEIDLKDGSTDIDDPITNLLWNSINDSLVTIDLNPAEL